MNWLDWLADRVEVLRNLVGDLANAVAGVWLLGEYLSWPLYQAWFQLYYAVGLLRAGATGWQVVQTIVDRLSSPGGFALLLFWLAPTLWKLIYNPSALIRELVQAYFPSVYPFLYAAHLAVLAILQQWLPVVYQLGIRPLPYLRELLGQVVPGFSTLTTNPAQWVLSVLAPRLPGGAYLLTDPVQTLYSLVVRVSPGLFGVLEDPAGWALAQVQKAVDRNVEKVAVWVKTTAEKLILYLWES